MVKQCRNYDGFNLFEIVLEFLNKKRNTQFQTHNFKEPFNDMVYTPSSEQFSLYKKPVRLFFYEFLKGGTSLYCVSYSQWLNLEIFGVRFKYS